MIDGQDLLHDRTLRECQDPSRPGVTAGLHRQADAADISKAVECAARDESGWRQFSPQERQTVLRQVAQELRKARADLMGAALSNAGKTLAESDPEVSEAIDFVEFYAENGRWFMEDLGPGVQVAGKGVVVVVSP